MDDRLVVLGMSGGVDSSVAAFLLKQAGYRVHGVMLRTWRSDQKDQLSEKEQVLFDSTRRVADVIGVSLEMADTREMFFEKVIGYFRQAYTSGLTPNPCTVCNREIKFASLLKKADELGATWIATGHYVRLVRDAEGVRITQPSDIKKDQTYFLSHLTQPILTRTLFPLADLTKDQVRQIARENHIETVNRPESQDLCFLEGTDYREIMLSLEPGSFQPGDIVDSAGTVLGQHNGLANYTIGQRKGLGIFREKPLFVLKKDPQRNLLMVGYEDELGTKRFWVEQINWIIGHAPDGTFSAQVKIRYQARPRQAMVTVMDEGRILVETDEFLRDVTPGQFAVLYDGDTLVGGGIISSETLADAR